MLSAALITEATCSTVKYNEIEDKKNVIKRKTMKRFLVERTMAMKYVATEIVTDLTDLHC